MCGPSVISHAEFHASLEALLAKLPSGLVKDHAFFQLPSNQPPWFDTGIDLDAGDRVTTFAVGRTRLDGTDLWFGPGFQLWARIGERGEVFRGVRASNSFTVDDRGKFYLASYFPGEWASPTGELATPPEAYQMVSGAMSVAVIRWSVDPLEGLRQLAAQSGVNGRDNSEATALIATEIDRLSNPVETPEGWRYLWFIGPAEIYRPCESTERAAAICCHTRHDVGLLIKDAPAPFEPGLRLRWSWKVDMLPSEVAENELANHDYLSIAVEFDNGQDLTYYWSANLPVGTSYRCPIPAWAGRETHMVVRSGQEELGVWLDEERDVYADYAQAVGGPLPAKVTRVWLIAVSLFQRGEGKCRYSDITLLAGDKVLKVQ
jgi:hypothetical protein